MITHFPALIYGSYNWADLLDAKFPSVCDRVSKLLLQFLLFFKAKHITVYAVIEKQIT